MLVVGPDRGLRSELMSAIDAPDRVIQSMEDDRAAARRLVRGGVSLVLLDLRSRRSHQVLDAAKADGVPVFAVVTEQTADDVAEARENGASEVFEVPVDAAALATAARQALDGSGLGGPVLDEPPPIRAEPADAPAPAEATAPDAASASPTEAPDPTEPRRPITLIPSPSELEQDDDDDELDELFGDHRTGELEPLVEGPAANDASNEPVAVDAIPEAAIDVGAPGPIEAEPPAHDEPALPTREHTPEPSLARVPPTDPAEAVEEESDFGPFPVPAGAVATDPATLRTLLQGVRSLGGAPSERRLASRVLKIASELAQATGASLYAVTPTGKATLMNQGTEHIDVMELLAPNCLVARTHTLLEGSATERRELELPDDALHGPTIAWPLRYAGKARHVLFVFRTAGHAPFTTSDADVLGILASHAALAFDRSAAADELAARSEELDRVNERLREAEQAAGIGEMATSYAHEMNNPMQYLQSQLRESLAALDGLGDEVKDARDSLRYARDGADRVQAMVGELSAIGRARDDAYFPADRLVGIAKRMTESKHGVEVSIKCEDIAFAGNISTLAHAVHQVLDNAIRAAESRVDVRAYQQGQVGRIDITDDGGGMPKNVYARIFEPLFTTRDNAPGMGLNVARDIVQAAGGVLEVATRFGEGTTAAIVLPLSVDGQLIPLPEAYRESGAALDSLAPSADFLGEAPDDGSDEA